MRIGLLIMCAWMLMGRLSGQYQRTWQLIEDLDKYNFKRAALGLTEALYVQVKSGTTETRQAEMLKALLCKYRFKKTLEERESAEYLVEMEAAAADFDAVGRSVLYSLLADFYFDTPTDWNAEGSERESLDKALALLWRSLSEEAACKVSLEHYLPVLDLGERWDVRFQPYLYDVLWERAWAMLSGNADDFERPIDYFYLERAEEFGDVDTYLGLAWTSEDSLSGDLLRARLLQRILAQHRGGEHLEALVEQDLQRLSFMLWHSIHKDKEQLYKSRLEAMTTVYKGKPACAMVWYHLAWRAFKAEEYELALRYAGEGAAYKQSFGGANCEGLTKQIKGAEFSVKVEATARKGASVLALLAYRNLSRLHYRVVTAGAGMGAHLDTLPLEKSMKYLAGLPVLRAGQWALPTGGYAERHVEASLEGLDYGHYYVLVSADGGFGTRANAITYAPLHVTDIGYTTQAGVDSARIYVADRGTGRPLAGVKVVFEDVLRTDDELQDSVVVVGEGRSDSAGVVAYNLERGWGYRVSRRMRFVRDGDTLLAERPQVYGMREEREARMNRTFFLLDRAVYRPGQVVHFKAISFSMIGYGEEAALLKGRREVILYAGNLERVASLSCELNAYGSYSGSFTLPSGGRLGSMYLEDSETGSRTSFAVEEYKRKKFSLIIDDANGPFALGQRVVVRGAVQGNAGTASSGAKLQYKVSRVAESVDLYDFASERAVFISAGDTVCDAEGRFAIPFMALVGKKVEPTQRYTYSIEITATDINGETQVETQDIVIGGAGFELDMAIPRRLAKGRAGAAEVKAANLSGKPLNCVGELSIARLDGPKSVCSVRYWEGADSSILSEAEFGRQFPNYMYPSKADTGSWAVIKQLPPLSFDTKNAKSVAFGAVLAEEAAGLYRVIATAKDELGQSVRDTQYFELFEPNSAEFGVPTALFCGDTDLRVEPDSVAVLDFGTSREDGHVFLYVEFKGAPIVAQWFKGGKRIKYPIKIEEKHRGAIYFQLFTFHDGRAYEEQGKITIPWSNKRLNIQYESFRDKLQPGQAETWTLKISGAKGEKVAAELAASLYDAALDDIYPHAWDLWLYRAHDYRFPISISDRETIESAPILNNNYIIYGMWASRNLATLRTYGFNVFEWDDWETKVPIYIRYKKYSEYCKPRLYEAEAVFAFPPPPPPPPAMQFSLVSELLEARTNELTFDSNGSIDSSAVGTYTVTVADANGCNTASANNSGQLRRNLSELVFFYPQMHTDSAGRVVLKFTMNEALTRWRLLLLAHTQDLAIGQSQNEVVTQKELMIQPNFPRFLRQGDTVELVAKVSSLNTHIDKGSAQIELLDAATNAPLDNKFKLLNTRQSFSIAANRSIVLRWRIAVPKDWENPVAIRCYAEGNQHTDGEENQLPTISNRILLTETLPLHLPAKQNTSFDFARIAQTQASSTAQPYKYTLEFTPNPIWYAIYALPYLAEYPHECSEQLFSRLYANNLAAHIANQPSIRAAISEIQQDSSPISPLLRNQNLKSALLEETPWLLQGTKNNIKSLATLLDTNRIKTETQKIIAKLQSRQLANGLFTWFDGGTEDAFISQHILASFAQLKKLQIPIANNPQLLQMLNKTAEGLDRKYAAAAKMSKNVDWASSIHLHYFYARSFFEPTNLKNAKNALDSIAAAAKNQWTTLPKYEQALIALALHRYGDSQTPKIICASFLQTAIENKELGLYWKPIGGYGWHRAPIETHALIMEAFHEITNDQNTVEKLKIWLIKHKQTHAWPSTKSTLAACYALFMRGITTSLKFQPLEVRLGRQLLPTPKPEAGSGYFQHQWLTPNIPQNPNSIHINNPNPNIAWGAAYWQYFEQADKATSAAADSAVSIQKQLLREVQSPKGPQLVPLNDGQALRVGERLVVRLLIKTDRELEYVHIKDMRAAGLEPAEQISGYDYSGGLGYYHTPRDRSNDFFISSLPSGQHTLEYSLYAQHGGYFSNGITSLQCMYAPEFAAHTEGRRIQIAY